MPAPLSYLMAQLNTPEEAFTAAWKSLTEKDKKDLKQWAVEEMAALGIESK